MGRNEPVVPKPTVLRGFAVVLAVYAMIWIFAYGAMAVARDVAAILGG